jgi:hypothetical protein
MTKWASYILLGAVAVAGLTGCKKGGVVLRDPQVYKNEIAFMQMALEQDTELLAHHLGDGSCSCEDGAWVSVECEDTALNILVIQHRLQYHVDLMLYNAKMKDERPPAEPPEVPEPGSLCPGE